MKQRCFLISIGWIVSAFAGCALDTSAPHQPAATASTRAIYVAPDGSDRTAGTLDHPLKTIAAARDRIRLMNSDTKRVVYLRQGVYPLQQALLFTPRDSGRPDNPIVYCAYPGETVKLIGGKALAADRFKPVTDPDVLNRIIDPRARRHILMTDLTANGLARCGRLSLRGFPDHDPKLVVSSRKQPPPMELFFGGKRLTIARWPNDHQVSMAEVIDPGPTWDWDLDDTPQFWQRGGTFRYEFDRPQLWSHADDVWINGILSKAWVWTFNKIKKLDPQAQTITLRYGTAEGGIQIADDAHFGNHFFFQHILEEIDQPGEYYIDYHTKTLYLWPPDGWGDSDEKLVASLLQKPLLDFQQARHIVFRNIILEGGRDFAVRCQDSDAIELSGCEIRNFTRGGLLIDAMNTRVSHCHIHHIGGSAIHLLGGDFETLTPADNLLTDCDIHDFGYWDKVYYPGVTLRGVGQTVSHCRIHNGPHMGIMIYGNEQRIEKNEIFNVPNMFRDMHAIYLNLGDVPAERGIVIAENYFHDIGTDNDGGKQGAVYLDSSTNGVTIEKNLFYHIGSVKNDWTVMVHGGSYNIVRDNVFVDCVKPYFSAFWLTTWGKHWIPWYQKRWQALFEKYDFASMPHAQKYPELLNFLKEDRLIPDTNRFENNVIYNPHHPVIGQPVEVKDAPHSVLKEKNTLIMLHDPGFVDADQAKWAWKPDAWIFKQVPQLKNTAFDRAGLLKPRPDRQ